MSRISLSKKIVACLFRLVPARELHACCTSARRTRTTTFSLNKKKEWFNSYLKKNITRQILGILMRLILWEINVRINNILFFLPDFIVYLLWKSFCNRRVITVRYVKVTHDSHSEERTKEFRMHCHSWIFSTKILKRGKKSVDCDSL